MKKYLAVAIALLMIFTLAACGGKGDDKAPANTDEKKPSSSQQQAQKPTEVDKPSDPNAPISSVNNAAGRGSYIKHNADDAQQLLVSMGLPKYSDGEIIYATQFKDDNSGTVYIKDTSLNECISYCLSLSGVSPVYADSNSNGKYINYPFKGYGFDFTVKFFEQEQKKNYTLNGQPATDIWQAEIDFTPASGGSSETANGSVIAKGWEIPEYTHGELVYTKYNDGGAVAALYFNNTTIEECHKYCLALEKAGYMEVFNNDIHEDKDGLGRWIDYIGMHPSSYINYQVDYPSEKMEHTVDTPDGKVAYQLVIRNRGK